MGRVQVKPARRLYQYSYFCELYQKWRGKLNLTLRQKYRAGEKMLVDYAGQKMPVIDPISGGIHTAHVFVSVLAASNYTYAEGVLSLDLMPWISSHCRAFEYFPQSQAKFQSKSQTFFHSCKTKKLKFTSSLLEILCSITRTINLDYSRIMNYSIQYG